MLPRVLAFHPVRRGFGAVVLEHGEEPLEAFDGVHEDEHGVVVPLLPDTRFDAGEVSHRRNGYTAARAHTAVPPAGIAYHWRNRSAFRNLHLCLSDALLRRVAEDEELGPSVEMRPTLALESPGLHVVGASWSASSRTTGTTPARFRARSGNGTC